MTLPPVHTSTSEPREPWWRRRATWVYAAIQEGRFLDHGAADVSEYAATSTSLGRVVVPQGRLVVCDGGTFDDVRPLRRTLAGESVEVVAVRAMVDATRDHRRNAALVLVAGQGPIVRWEMGTVDDDLVEDPTAVAEGSFVGFGVDSGSCCAGGVEAMRTAARVVHEDEGMLEDPISQALLSESAGDAGAAVLAPESGAELIAAATTGWGDGTYPTWLGVDAEGAAVVAVVDFLVARDPFATTAPSEPAGVEGAIATGPSADPELERHAAARRQMIEEFLDRRDAIEELPPTPEAVDAWDELIEDCERAELPRLVASSLLAKHHVLAQIGLLSESLETYRRLTRLIAEQGDLLASESIDLFLDSVSTAATYALLDASVTLERIDTVVAEVERVARAQGRGVAGACFARAAVAAAAGDERATQSWLERLHAEGSDLWEPEDPAVLELEIPLIARFDVDTAAATLERRLRHRGAELAPASVAAADDESLASCEVMLARLRQLQGHEADAAADADRLLAECGLDALLEDGPLSSLIPLLEHRPEAALVATDFALRNLGFGASDDWEVLAAVARSRQLAAPGSAEAALLRAYATEKATALDARGGTGLHRRTLDEVWFHGLEDGPATEPPPALASSAEPVDRAEAILTSGWLNRNGPVLFGEAPVALQPRYLDLLQQVSGILQAPSPEDADDMVAEFDARARRLADPVILYYIALLHGIHASSNGDVAAFADRYQLAQARLQEFPDTLHERFQGAADASYSAVLRAVLTSPAVPWTQIRAIVHGETLVRDQVTRTRSSLLLGDVLVAAHLEDVDGLRQAAARLRACLDEEEERVDRDTFDVQVLNAIAPYLPEEAGALAAQIEAVAEDTDLLIAQAWLAWFGIHSGDPAAPAQMRKLLDSVDGDVTAFGSLPGWVLLEGAFAAGMDVVPLIDAMLEDLEPVDASDIDTVACAAGLLLEQAPQDPRGARLRARAWELSGALDTRDGATTSADRVRTRWLPEGPDAGRQ